MNNTAILIGLVVLFVILFVAHHYYDVYRKHLKVQAQKEAKLHKKLRGDRSVLRTTIKRQISERFEEPPFGSHPIIKIVQAIITTIVVIVVSMAMFVSLEKNVTNQTVNSTEAGQIANVTSELAKSLTTISSFFPMMIVIVIILVPIIIYLKYIKD